MTNQLPEITAYSLDDVMLIPQYNPITSRLDVDLSTVLTKNLLLKVPIMATNMATVTEVPMAKALYDNGGVGALHRFMDIKDQIKMVQDLKNGGVNPIVASIGVGDKEYIRAIELDQAGADAILIDVAHAHSSMVDEQLYKLKSVGIETIVGNVATYDGAMHLLNSGADALRVGIGGGKNCTTRLVTGHGFPNLSALIQAANAREEYCNRNATYVPIIIDGGIKNSGDIVKALYFGADVACMGNMFAGTDESPGDILETEHGVFKKHYGLSSKDAMDIHKGGKRSGIAPEGITTMVPYKGSVVPIIEDLIGGIRSGLTYSGAKDIMEFRDKGKAFLLSNASRTESKL